MLGALVVAVLVTMLVLAGRLVAGLVLVSAATVPVLNAVHMLTFITVHLFLKKINFVMNHQRGSMNKV